MTPPPTGEALQARVFAALEADIRDRTARTFRRTDALRAAVRATDERTLDLGVIGGGA